MLLRDPVLHWREGYSAMSLATSWQGQDGFPVRVQQLFESSAIPSVSKAEMLLGIPEHPTELPGRGRPSYNDILVLARSTGGLICMTVEGKVRETFGGLVDEWLHRDQYKDNRRTRLSGLCELLEIDISDSLELRYQLLHRTAAALIEAERFSAETAAMLVHSFSPDQEGLDDYVEFGRVMGGVVGSDRLVDMGMRSGRRLLLGWLTDPIERPMPEA